MLNTNDTICAVATPPGGALGIIRISGPDAIKAAEAIFKPVGASLASKAPYSLSYGKLIDSDGSFLDDVLVSVFRAPHSYTGEDSIEISCHGSAYILKRAGELLIAAGCRMAEPGEYTRRAFLAGKMDLSQAEAVADLIAASSSSAHRLAANQMKGSFSSALNLLKNKLIEFKAKVELELDFSEEDVQFADREELVALAREIESTLSRLADSFHTGDALKNGIPVAIIGRTNTGKSTLLNLLLGDDRAIVSDTEGTTRDSIEDTVTIGGVLLRFIDTAGIRHTTDNVERLGMERTLRKAAQASVILLVDDCSLPSLDADAQISLPELEGKALIRVHNKCDKLKSVPSSTLQDVYISAKQEINIDALKQAILASVSLPQPTEEDVTVSNLRHYEALVKALECIRRVIGGIGSDLPGDLMSQDLSECIFHLQDILGQVTTDQVLQLIFSRFCIGK